MFYLDWLKAQYDSTLLTYMKNVALILPVGIAIAYLWREWQFQQHAHMRRTYGSTGKTALLLAAAAVGTLILAGLLM